MRGFNEQGTTTTPFDMVVLNGMSRYHLAAEALRRVPRLHAAGTDLVAEANASIARAVAYSRDHLQDMPEIADWTWDQPFRP